MLNEVPVRNDIKGTYCLYFGKFLWTFEPFVLSSTTQDKGLEAFFLALFKALGQF